MTAEVRDAWEVVSSRVSTAHATHSGEPEIYDVVLLTLVDETGLERVYALHREDAQSLGQRLIKHGGHA